MNSKQYLEQVTLKKFLAILLLFNFASSTNIMIYIPDQYELPGIDSVLTEGGFDVTVTNRTATPVISDAVLANYNQFWLWSHATTGENLFSDSELYSIRNFWQAGGSLVLLADDVNYQYQDFPNQICDSLNLGIRFFETINHGQSLIPVLAPDFDISHQLWSNVDSVFGANHEGNIEITDSSNVSVIGKHNNANMVVIGEYGGIYGKIVFQSSFVKFGDGYITLGDNAQHAINIADWLEIPPTAIVAYYPFNGNANDESGNGNNGTVNGATLINDRFGNINSAYSFDGVDDFIDVDSLDAFSENIFTYTGWIFLDSTQTEIPVVLNTPSGMFHLASFGASIHPVVFDNRNGASPGHYIRVDNALNPNQWFFFSLAAEGNDLTLYLDGDLISNTSTSQGYSGVWASAEIGADGRTNASRDRYFHGIIDDIRIYNRKLSDAEIDSLYHLDGWPILETGLVAYYPFNSNANDESGNGNDGTVNGATLIEDRFNSSNSAYYFDGQDDYIGLGNSNSLSFGQIDAITISGFINFDSYTSQGGNNERSVINKYYEYIFQTNENRIPILAIYDQNSGNWRHYSDSNYSFNEGEWYHFAIIYNDTSHNAQFFFNGEQVFGQWNIQPNSNIVEQSSNLEMGREYQTNTGSNLQYFHGMIDDVRIYNRVLNSSEIDSLYHENGWQLNVFNGEELPNKMSLHQNFPNPFNPVTTLRYDVPERSLIKLTIYDVLGREVRSLVNQIQEPGFKTIQWNARDNFGRPVGAGVYLYRIEAGAFIQTNKMILLK